MSLDQSFLCALNGNLVTQQFTNCVYRLQINTKRMFHSFINSILFPCLCENANKAHSNANSNKMSAMGENQYCSLARTDLLLQTCRNLVSLNKSQNRIKEMQSRCPSRASSYITKQRSAKLKTQMSCSRAKRRETTADKFIAYTQKVS